MSTAPDAPTTGDNLDPSSPSYHQSAADKPFDQRWPGLDEIIAEQDETVAERTREAGYDPQTLRPLEQPYQAEAPA